MKIPRNHVNSETDSISKKTKSSIFINFMVQICFIPVTITKEKIIFKIFHWKTLIYFILLIGYVLFFFSIKFLGITSPTLHFNHGTEMEMISVTVVVILALILRILPLILSFGLQKMNPTRFQNKTHRKPKQTTRIMLGLIVKRITLTFQFIF